MNLTQEKALMQLSAKLDLGESSVETWQQVSQEHPYFAPVRFFMSAKLMADEHSMAGSQLLKTNLYFTNPYWLQFQLHAALEKEEATANEFEDSDTVTLELPRRFREKGVEILPVTDKTGLEAMEVPADDSILEETESLEQEISEPAAPAFETGITVPAVGETGETEMDETTGTEPPGNAANKIASVLSSQLADFRRPVDPEARLEIEAETKRLHTIDYFASQGIKLDLSSIPQDKLTTHLRKFTDWLKQMKNADTMQGDFGNSLEREKAVVATAQHSNETGEVLTEAMADVLEKQGQVDKAIQLYIKLSFLNPEKSSYFAAKIEQLKGI